PGQPGPAPRALPGGRLRPPRRRSAAGGDGRPYRRLPDPRGLPHRRAGPMMGRPSGSERLARVLGGLSGLSSLARTVPARRLVTAAQAAAAAAAAVRLARGRDRLPPLSPP